MSDLNEVGERDGWRCWLCDAPVDPDASVNADLGPSVDSFSVQVSKKRTDVIERLAHRQCNTMKGKNPAVVAWSPDLFVVDPSPIFATVERLRRKGGREIVARCPDQNDATDASAWLLDRLSRFAPDLDLETEIQPGGGQFVLILRAV
jgi:hypothetical protein